MIDLDIGGFLGFVDMNGIDAINEDKVAELEDIVRACNESANAGEHLVADAIYDKLMEILRRVSPESELCKYIWEDSVDELTDYDEVFRKHPMYSIQTVKSYTCDEIKSYVSRLPAGAFDIHISAKLNGHGIRLTYKAGELVQARSRARASAGRDLTKQIKAICPNTISDISGLELCEIRGEWCLPFSNFTKAGEYREGIVSAFSGVSAMGKESGTEKQWKLLRFVAYELLADDFEFETKEEEYDYLNSLGFETPANWVIEGITPQSFISEIKGIVEDCEDEVAGEDKYDYYTDGLICTINKYNMFRALGDDGGHYKYGNIALKVGYWSQDMYSGIIQTIVWMRGKTKLTPVAIVAPEDVDIEFYDLDDHDYVYSTKDIVNYDELGVVTAGGNKVRRVPLYEPSNILELDAYRGRMLYFRYGGEAGVVPCFPDGIPLLEGKAKNIIKEDYRDPEDYGYED